MPIKPEKKHLYPKDWKEIALKVKEEAGWRCERCGIPHNPDNPASILTVHHKDRNPTNNSRDNLVALCAKCHLQVEARLKMIERDRNRGQRYLFPDYAQKGLIS